MQDLAEVKDLPRSERVEILFEYTPFPYQAELLDAAEDTQQFHAALKPGRQVGKSVTGGHIAADRAIAGHDVMILAPFETTTEDMMESFRNAMETAREKFQDAGYVLGTEHENKTDWKFTGGGRCRAKTVGTEGTQIRGKNPDIVLVDEAAYIKDNIYDEVIEPYFLTHDEYEYYLFSTPAGKSGYFYNAVEGDNADSWWTEEWPSTINPLNDREWIEDKREEKDSLSFAQEYLGEFVDEGDSLFPYDVIEAVQGQPELGGKRWLGVDVAREGKDRTVYTEIDSDGHVRVVDSEQTSTLDGVLGRIKDLHREHGYETIVVEENSIGGGVVDFSDLEALQPFQSSTKSKHELYKQLQRDVESENITLPTHRRLIDELTSLQYDFTQHGYMKVSHPEGGHDDFPDSLAFANWGRTNANVVSRRSARASVSHNEV